MNACCVKLYEILAVQLDMEVYYMQMHFLPKCLFLLQIKMSWHIFASGHGDNFSFNIHLYKSRQRLNTLA